MKLKLLIADDEHIERKALEFQISNAFPELELLPSASNGLELLHRVREMKPNIVLCDIEMPGMNGLTALESLQADGLCPHVIIMTAYSSEYYLKQSLSLRVFEYLEKPLKRAIVEHTIRSVIAEVNDECLRSEELTRMRETVRSMQKHIRSELMIAIESDEADPYRIRELLTMLDTEAQRFVIVTFSIAEEAIGLSSTYDRRIEEMKAFETLRAAVESRNWISGHVINHRISCLMPVMNSTDSNEDYRIRRTVGIETESIIRDIGLNREIHAGISVATSVPETLQQARQQSIQALCTGDGHCSVYHYEDNPVLHENARLFANIETTLTESIMSGNIDRTGECITRCFESLKPTISINIIREQAFELLMTLNRRSGTQLFSDLLTDISDDIQSCADREALTAYIIRVCTETITRIRNEDIQRQDDVIQRTKRYIDACYMMDISLEQTAEAVGVSKFYLSRLFKTKLGMNYSIYLTKKRIHAAAILLRNRRELSIREISEQVGFRDANYFGKVFKKEIGCTVSAYRENSIGEEQT